MLNLFSVHDLFKTAKYDSLSYILYFNSFKVTQNDIESKSTLKRIVLQVKNQ